MQMQISEVTEKATSFNVDLSKLLLEDAWCTAKCITSLQKVEKTPPPPPLHHHTTITLLFQSGL